MRFKEKERIEIIEYLVKHWQDEPSLEEIAGNYTYSLRQFQLLFKETFGLPYRRFLIKLRLHRAGLIISRTGNLMEAGDAAGYGSPQSFSKAFRKEFGIPPKNFSQAAAEIPDMPVCCEIDGQPLSLTYITTDKKAVYGELRYFKEESGTGFLEAGNECSDYFVLGEPFTPASGKVSAPARGESCVHARQLTEVWWNDEQGRVCRMIGRTLDKSTKENISHPIITLQKDYYARFSVPYEMDWTEEAEEGKRISHIIHQVLNYAVREWAPINDKEIRQMGYLFISLEEGEVRIHIPVHKRAAGMQNQAPKFKGAAAWVQYIDDTIRENLTVPMLAEAFNYSERHFTDTFEMYFGIRPGRYIKKRKLYLAAKELTLGQKNIQKIVNSYGFPSVAAFRKSFHEEFSCYPEEYNEEEYRADNLNQHYTYIKKQTRLTMVKEDDILIAGRNVSSDGSRRDDQGDLIESIAWFLCYDFAEAEDAEEQGEKIVVWQTAKDRLEHYCLVGQRLKTEEQFEKFNPELYEKVHIRGGTYAVLETMRDSDKETLVDTYRMMYRCAFGGWLRENREKADLTRLTFVKYTNEKLYFYIPIYA